MPSLDVLDSTEEVGNSFALLQGDNRLLPRRGIPAAPLVDSDESGAFFLGGDRQRTDAGYFYVISIFDRAANIDLIRSGTYLEGVLVVGGQVSAFLTHDWTQ